MTIYPDILRKRFGRSLSLCHLRKTFLALVLAWGLDLSNKNWGSGSGGQPQKKKQTLLVEFDARRFLLNLLYVLLLFCDFFGKTSEGGYLRGTYFVVFITSELENCWGFTKQFFFGGGNFRWQNSHAMFECWKKNTGIYSMGFSVVLNSSEFRWHFFSAIGYLSRHLSRMEFPAEFPLNFAVQCVGASCGDFSGGSVIY